MRRLIYVLAAAAGLVYVSLAWEIYQQDRFAQLEMPLPLPRAAYDHPESNLRHLRDAFTANDFSNDLAPFLDAARREAPASYQSWFLTASFHAHRVDEPDRTQMAYAAAVRRFPANGRLRLGLAEWLLRPRSSLPYRTYREDPLSEHSYTERREQAMREIDQALSHEPELLRAAVRMLSRFDVPLSEWTLVLPDDDATKREILVVLNRPTSAADRRPYLEGLMRTGDLSSSLLRDIVAYSSRWEENEVWGQAAERWLEQSATEENPRDLSQAAALLAQSYIVQKQPHDALSGVRRGMAALREQQLQRTLGVDLLTRVATHLFDHREHELAQGLFVEALELAPRDSRARVGLARVHFRRGERVDAMRQLREVLELDPSHVQAAELMTRISIGTP